MRWYKLFVECLFLNRTILLKTGLDGVRNPTVPQRALRSAQPSVFRITETHLSHHFLYHSTSVSLQKYLFYVNGNKFPQGLCGNLPRTVDVTTAGKLVCRYIALLVPEPPHSHSHFHTSAGGGCNLCTLLCKLGHFGRAAVVWSVVCVRLHVGLSVHTATGSC